MKVHIYTPSFFPRLVGMTYAAHVRAQMLTELGADVTVIAPEVDGVRMSAPSPEYRVRRFGIHGSGMPWSPVRGEVRGLLDFVGTERAEIAISEGWYTWGTSMLPRLRSAYRHLVLASHGAADKSVGGMNAGRVARALTYRVVESFGLGRTISCLSAAIVLSLLQDKDRFSDIAPLRRAKVPLYVCPNSSTYIEAHSPRVLVATPMLLHVGEMRPHKNQLLGIEVLRRLPHAFRLTFAFPVKTSYFKEVDAAVSRAGLADRVVYVEGRDRTALEQVFEGASCLLILTPAKDTQPIVAIDGLCKGLPFVSTPVGCMKEIAGGLVVSAVASELASAVARVHRSESEYARWSSSALSFFRDRYRREHSLNSLRELLKSLS